MTRFCSCRLIETPAQPWENAAKQVAFDELHEGGGVGVEVMRARKMKNRITRGGGMDHGGDIELEHGFVKRIPMLGGQRRRGPVSAGRIGIEIAPDETQLID